MVMAKKKTVTKATRKKPEKRESIACPACKCLKSYVDTTKPADDAIVRYRICFRCGRRFSTEEKRKW
jgi:DNA-directed RNA polymerase subunit M/transcription elongation factor TFIIS